MADARGARKGEGGLQGLREGLHRQIDEALDEMTQPSAKGGTTCFIESLVKRFNRRVKASDKFWVQSSLEAVLQVRAASLSEDQRWEKFWHTRSGRLAAASRPYHARAS